MVHKCKLQTKNKALKPRSDSGSEPGFEPGSELGSELGSEPGSEPGFEPAFELGSELRSKPGSTLCAPLAGFSRHFDHVICLFFYAKIEE